MKTSWTVVNDAGDIQQEADTEFKVLDDFERSAAKFASVEDGIYELYERKAKIRVKRGKMKVRELKY